MDPQEEETTSNDKHCTEESENLADDADFQEIIHIDEILSNSDSNQVKMLDFERQMFLDCVYNDALAICGK